MDNTFSDIRNVYLAYLKKIGNRMAMYREVIKTFSVESILYPGSHIDLEQVKKTLKGPKYKKQAKSYLFQLIH